jgi:seryl-tRNA synthetase
MIITASKKMVLDIQLFRTPEGIETLKKSQEKRFLDTTIVDDIRIKDEEWRKYMFERSKYSKIENMIKKVIGIKNKENKKEKKVDKKYVEDIENNSNQPDLKYMRIFDNLPEVSQDELNELEIDALILLNKVCSIRRETFFGQKEEECKDFCHDKMKMIGNILNEQVPIGPNDDSNVILETVGEFTEKKYIHSELLEKIDGVDCKAGSKIAGNRGYFLKGACVFLTQALQQLALRMLDDKEYMAIQTPYFMNSDMMESVSQLSQFDEELYKIIDDDTNNEQNTKYLIATSEQPLTIFHSNEKFRKNDLPIRYAGVSTCFRREAGRHGKDTGGIFRVHQFEKIEQFIICSSNDDSWIHLDQMIRNSKEFLDELKIPYRVVNIASGELNLAAAKKFDIEGWFPGSKTFRELVSCSNCTDYHSRNLNIQSHDGKYVHMLNGTMCAVTRMLCVILENYQSEKGIIIPIALQQYMPQRFKELIPYV